MLSRLLGVPLLVLLLAVFAFAIPASAVEENGGPDLYDLPKIDEIGTGSETAQQFFPEEPEEQPWAWAILYPLMGLAVIVTLVILVRYLRWQPTFSREQESRRR